MYNSNGVQLLSMWPFDALLSRGHRKAPTPTHTQNNKETSTWLWKVENCWQFSPSVENYAKAMEPFYIYLLDNSRVPWLKFARDKTYIGAVKMQFNKWKWWKLKQKRRNRKAENRQEFEWILRSKHILYALYNFWFKVNSSLLLP